MALLFEIMLLHCCAHLLLQHVRSAIAAENRVPLVDEVIEEVNENERAYVNLAKMLGKVNAANLEM